MSVAKTRASSLPRRSPSASASTMAMEYTSSPVAQAGTHTRTDSPAALPATTACSARASSSKTSGSRKKDDTEIMKLCWSRPSSSGLTFRWAR